MKRLLSLMLAAVMMVSSLTVTHAESTENPENYPPVEQTYDREEVDPSTVRKPKAGLYAGKQRETVRNDEDAATVIYGDDDVVRVSIQLETPSTLDAGYSVEDIANNSSAMNYREGLQNQQRNVESSINRIGVDIDVVWNLTLAANIISADVKYGDISKIERLYNVKKVFVENYYEQMRSGDEPNTSFTTKEMVYATQAWANGYTGAGTKVAIIDTGTNVNHASFDAEALEYALTQEGKSLSDYDLLTKETVSSLLGELNVSVDADKVYIDTKNPFAYNYIDDDYDIDHSNDDASEHGSHVAGIAAANRYVSDGNGGFVDAASTVYAVGVAPDAQIITMKVFGKGGGAYDSDYMAAIEDAIVLGADSINLSLGSANPGMAYSDEYQDIMDGLSGKGAVVVMSAGNSYSWNSTVWPYGAETEDESDDITFPYPGYMYVEDVSFDTVGSPGSFHNSLTVASADNVGITGMPLIFDGAVNAFYNETESNGARMVSIADTYDYVYIDGVGEADEYEKVNAEISLEGKIVIVNRGEISFYVKGNNAINYNPAAVVVANNDKGSLGMNLTGYTGTFPMVLITLDAAKQIKNSEPKNIGGYDVYTGKVEVTDYNVTQLNGSVSEATVSDFSSWGVPGSLTLKPEIVAPGGDIFSVNGFTDDDYELMSGTSMAAPHVTGMAALLAQYVKENDLAKWTDGNARTLINSLLMSTALPMMDPTDGGDYYYPVLQQGAGLGNVYAATQALSFIMMNDDATLAYSDGKVKAELGDDPDREGKYSFSFNITNMSDDDLAYEFATDMFTQFADTDGEKWYVTPYTDYLDATVVYDWSDEEVEGHDVDLDGDTDYDDAQALLDYVTGKEDGKEWDLEAGEMDEVEGISSYDAKLLIDWLASMGIATEGQILVRSGETRNITVTITLNDTESMDEIYPNGAYVEGFTYVTCVSTTDDGGLLDVSHSIPILGFYGNWTDASMFDNTTIDEVAFGTNDKIPYAGEYYTNYMTVRYAGDKTDSIFLGNPYDYSLEDEFPVDRLALSDDVTIKRFEYNLIRNAGTLGLAAVKVDENGDPVETAFTGELKQNAESAFYHVNEGRWHDGIGRVKDNVKVRNFGLSEDDRFILGVYAVPEYNIMKENGNTSGNADAETFADIISSGELGRGVYTGYTFTLDNTAPVIDNVTVDQEAGTVTVTLSDNNYVALVEILDSKGNIIYDYALPEQSKANEKIEHVFELDEEVIEEILSTNAVVVLAGDYAANESAELIKIDPTKPVLDLIPVYRLTDEFVPGKEYIIAHTNEPGYAAVAYGYGDSYPVFVEIAEVLEDEEGPYIIAEDNAYVWYAEQLFGEEYGPEFINKDNGLVIGLSGLEDDSPLVTHEDPRYAFDFYYYPDYSLLYTTYGQDIYSVGLSYVEAYDDYFFVTSSQMYSVYLYTLEYKPVAVDTEAATAVEVDPSAVTLIYKVKDEADLTATVYPIYIDNKDVTWESSDPEVVTVDENGHITAVGLGTAQIIAKSVQTPSVYGIASVSVVDGTPMDAVVYGQIETKEGVQFVEIDLSDMSYESIGEGITPYIGGGQAGQYIYGNDADYTFYRYIIGEDGIVFDGGYEYFGLNEPYSYRDVANIPYFSIGEGEDLVEFDFATAGITQGDYFLLLTEDGGGTYFDFTDADYPIIANTYVGSFEMKDEETGEPFMTNWYYLLDAAGDLYYLYFHGTESGGLSGDIGLIGNVDLLSVGDDLTAYSMTYTDELCGTDGVFIADNITKGIFYAEISINEEEETEVSTIFVGRMADVDNLTILFDLGYDGIEEASRKAPEWISNIKVNKDAIQSVDVQLKENEASIEEPAIEETVIEEATVEEVAETTEEAAVEIEEPAEAVEETTVEEPVIETAEEPVVETESAEEPTIEEAVTEEPEVEGPVTEETVAETEPVTEEPATEESGESNEAVGTLNAVWNYSPKNIVTAKAVIKTETAEDDGSKVTITYTEDVDVTNALITVTYDPELLTYVETKCDLKHFSVNPEEGVITFAFASEEAELKGNILAQFIFEVGCEDADVTIEVSERDSDLDLSEKTVSEVEGTGHDYGEPEWTWAEDYSTATATFTCANNEEHVLVEKAEVSVEKVEATTSKEGKITYTAKVVVNGKEYTDVKTVILPKTPDTGDHSNINGWYRTFMAGVAGMYVAIVLLRKDRKETAE
ncbi:MAG: S8 family serine peptidase [Erysipelotrichaceae bacterium]|nr:S8 family serine peptidase [Erysipelotrichaceae bacterium]